MTSPARALAPQPDWLELTVSRKQALAEGIVLLELRADDGGPLPPFAAGAHVDLRLPAGQVRQYSLCNDPADGGRYELAVQLEAGGRGGSRAVHQDVAVGSRLQVGAPRNLFALAPGRHALLLAGGIGITPLLSMAAQLTREQRSFELHYSARSVARMAFRERIAGAPFAGRAHLYVDELPDRRFDAAQRLPLPSTGAHAYVCGPSGFMDHVIDVLAARGWPAAQIHCERFAPAEPAPAGGGFELQLGFDGPVIAVGPQQTAAAALIAAGVAVPLSCEQGICGSCALRVLAGAPEHNDMFFSEAERAANDRFTPCCSRARSPRLVLDLSR